ncbi:MAG: extracellular solute-binding protein [Sedimentisphaerales bacterium]|nr:extracellular solute-binding protein [Sedimentisphaerales bacterium]
MRKGSSRISRGLFGFLITACCILAFSCSDKDSGSQREVVLYCSVDQEYAESIVGEFEKLTGIKVRTRFDSEATKTLGLVQRIRAEAASPVADVFWSSEIFYTIRLAREELLMGYKSQQTDDWPALFMDPNGLWHGFALRGRVIGYSTERVSPEDAPRSLEDVLDSKWKGRLVMAEPAFGTTGGDVASWFAHYGPVRARQILEGLKANEMRLVAGNSTAVRMVATGQADICFTDTDDVYAAQRNGWAIGLNHLDQGGDGSLAIPNTAALIKGAPHIEEAAVLMDFLLSGRLEELLAQSDSHNYPIHPEVAKRYESYSIPKPLDVDYSRVAEELSSAIETAREVLR